MALTTLFLQKQRTLLLLVLSPPGPCDSPFLLTAQFQNAAASLPVILRMFRPPLLERFHTGVKFLVLMLLYQSASSLFPPHSSPRFPSPSSLSLLCSSASIRWFYLGNFLQLWSSKALACCGTADLPTATQVLCLEAAALCLLYFLLLNCILEQTRKHPECTAPSFLFLQYMSILDTRWTAATTPRVSQHKLWLQKSMQCHKMEND